MNSEDPLAATDLSHGAEEHGAAGPPVTPVILPPSVRERLIGLAADALSALPASEVPPRLRSVARFTPTRRARAGASALATVLDTDPAFRARVCEVARTRFPEVSGELEAGRVPAAADPVDITVLAYLLRLPGWEEWVSRVDVADSRDSRAIRDAEAEIARLHGQLTAARAQAQTARDEQKAAVASAKTEASSLRGAVAEAKRGVAAATEAARQATAAAEKVTAEAASRDAAGQSELRRMRARVEEAEAALEASRQAARAGRTAEDVRLRLLLDTVVAAAGGLRRELALPPTAPDLRPADAVLAGEVHGDASGAARSRALAADDPATLDLLLSLPQVHLLVDGYNVTKTGYGSLPLEAQRARLVGGLAALRAQTGAEVTCVFDGADLDHAPPTPTQRGVRVKFSPAGVTADSLIRQYVRAEPDGRPVVVVSTDREVVDGVVAAGARAVASIALVRRLERG